MLKEWQVMRVQERTKHPSVTGVNWHFLVLFVIVVTVDTSVLNIKGILGEASVELTWDEGE